MSTKQELTVIYTVATGRAVGSLTVVGCQLLGCRGGWDAAGVCAVRGANGRGAAGLVLGEKWVAACDAADSELVHTRALAAGRVHAWWACGEGGQGRGHWLAL